MASSTDGYELLTTIKLPGTQGGHGDWVTYDPDTASVWLAQSPDNNVVVLDTATNSIKAVIPDIGNANGIALTPQYAFVADVTNNTTDVIDKNTFKVVARLVQSGTTPDSVTYISSTNQVAVASDDNNVEDFINASAPFQQTASLQLTPNPAASGPDVALYVPSKDMLYQPDDKQVDLINPHSGAIVATWQLVTTGTVKPMVYDPTTNQFVVGTTNKQLLVVDGDTGAIKSTIAISGSVDEGAIDVAGRRAFFGDKAGVVDVVNLDTGQLAGTLPAGTNMHTLTVDPTTHDVYAYEGDANTVDVFGRPGDSAGLSVKDNTSGTAATPAWQAYTGPVAGLQRQYVNTSSDNLSVSVTAPNVFVHTGSGTDAIDVSGGGGTNVLDGGTGSNFLVGGRGSGADTFFVDDRGRSADIWSTAANFHAGDAATLFGITQQGTTLDWENNQGAAGFTGLTLHALVQGAPTASLTLAGFTTDDLTNGRLSTSFGTEQDGTPYLYIHASS